MKLQMIVRICCLAALALLVVTAEAGGNCDPGFSGGYINVVSGTLAGQTLEAGDPRVLLAGGSQLQGTITIAVANIADLGLFPVAATPSWGDHATSGWEITWHQDHGIGYHAVAIDLTVPTEPGTYYLFFAASWEGAWSNILSCTHWTTPGGNVWNDGCDVADWTDIEAQEAIASGWVCSKWLTEGGLVDATIPAAAVRITVTGACSPDWAGGSIAVTGGTLGGHALTPDNPGIRLPDGGPLQGTVNIHVVNNGAPGNVYPVCATTTWGDHATSGWTVTTHQPPGGADYAVPVDVIVPSALGTYEIFFAAGWELYTSNVLSCTNWATPGGNVWNDGHDVADWTDAQAQNAMTLGWVCCTWLTTSGLIDTSVPAAAVRITVGPPVAVQSKSWGAIKDLFR
jgi:hypothetical protein